MWEEHLYGAFFRTVLMPLSVIYELLSRQNVSYVIDFYFKLKIPCFLHVQLCFPPVKKQSERYKYPYHGNTFFLYSISSIRLKSVRTKSVG